MKYNFTPCAMLDVVAVANLFYCHFKEARFANIHQATTTKKTKIKLKFYLLIKATCYPEFSILYVTYIKCEHAWSVFLDVA